jgi:hypothetical protein
MSKFQFEHVRVNSLGHGKSPWLKIIGAIHLDRAIGLDGLELDVLSSQFKGEFCDSAFVHRECESGCPKNIVQSLVIEMLVKIRADLAVP